MDRYCRSKGADTCRILHPQQFIFCSEIYEKKLVALLQINEEDATLVEIGPRFVLNLIKIFRGSFGGQTLYENPHYQSPNMVILFFLSFALCFCKNISLLFFKIIQ